jgi:hypothetical protein
MPKTFLSPLSTSRVILGANRINWFSLLVLSVLFFASCKNDDPKPVNEQEVVTTVMLTLIPGNAGRPVNMKFFDEDGQRGMISPVYTVSGSLKASTTYSATVTLLNETVSPALDILREIEAESGEHLFCFDIIGGITINYDDEDDNGLQLGVLTSWVTGPAGEAEVTVSLRHQPGTKTGECPGEGATDVEATFNLLVE